MNRQSYPKNMKAFAKTAFTNAYNALNPYKLSDLWTVSSLLSCIEYFDAFEDSFNCLFPTLNERKISMFDKAILFSSAREYKDKCFTSKKLAKIFNSLNDATYTDELSDENKDPNIKFLNFIANLANSQFQYQNFNILIYLARAFALYEYFPNIYRDKLKDKHKRNFIDIPVIFNDKFGISIKQYLNIGFALFRLYNIKYDSFLKPNEKLRNEIIKRRQEETDISFLQSKVLSNIIDN